MSATRLSDINFESFADVEVCDVLADLVSWGIPSLSALLDVLEEEAHNSGFVNSVINDLQAKVEDLESALERLAEQWDQGRLKASSAQPETEQKDNPETEVSEEPDLSGVAWDIEGPYEEDSIKILLEKSRVNKLKATSEFLENLRHELGDHESIIWTTHQNIIRQLAEQKKASREPTDTETPEA